MAAIRQVVPWTGTLDCKYLIRSSCKITKAGIGGPVVTLDGEVIGMNFYDTRIGTPFLLWKVILDILASFGEKSSAGDPSGVPFWKMAGDDSVRLYRWPVPIPCWRHPDYVDEDESEDDDELGLQPTPGYELQYNYINGGKAVLF